jgi:hypothetical protein
MILELVVNPQVLICTELIEIDADLKKELEQFEGAFERDEICGHINICMIF